MVRPEEKPEASKRRMIEGHLRGRGIDDERLLEAFRRIPRERFVPPSEADRAYEDHPLPIGHGQTISQPYVVALMIQELDVRGTHRVLDVGAGSGYQTAILAHLAKFVYGIERVPQLAQRAAAVLGELGVTNASVLTGDGSLGLPAHAPFDRIICGAGAPHVPEAWIEQLTEGGRILVPVGTADVQTLIAVEKTDRGVRRRSLGDVRFVRLIGEQGWRS